MARKKWTIRPADPAAVRRLAETLGVSSPVAQILVARGVETPEQAYAFLQPTRGQMHDPFLFSQMDAAVDRLARALEQGEKVLLYGDYDVDGLTSTSLLLNVLRDLKCDVDFFIPNRFQEGYGLCVERLKQAKSKGFSLLVTVDCGSKEVEPLEQARRIGLDVIVTDHHVVPGPVPPAAAILNPQIAGSGYPDRNLCGVGVAYKLALALVRRLGGDEKRVDRHLDLVAMGTIADSVPLLGENRYLVREGLRRLRQTTRVGLQALIEVSRTVQEQIYVRQVAFQLAPRINALGRLGDASGAVRLLVTDRADEAGEIAGLMEEANGERQRLQESVLEHIRRLAGGEPERFAEPVIVLGHPHWHRGVLGIAASKVSEWYGRPTVLCSIEEGMAHGSARSVPGVHITNALAECAGMLERFGGHAMAAGLTFQADLLPRLQERLGSIVQQQGAGGEYEPALEIDAEVRLEEISEELIGQLQDLGPFGESNPRPVFVAHGLSAGDTARIVGNGSLKLMVAQGNALIDAIAFRQGHLLGALDLNRLDVAFYPEINEWRGDRTLQLNVIDLRTSEAPTPIGAPAPPRPSAKAPVDLERVCRVSGDTLVDCWKAFDRRRRDRFAVVCLDTEERKGDLEPFFKDARTVATELDPSEWRLDAPPELILVLPGRRGPDCVRQLARQLRRLFPEAELGWASVRSEIKDIRKTLDDLYPSRERLLDLYRKAREAFGEECFELDDAVLALRGLSRSHISSGLKVFEELELLERHADQNRMVLRRVRARRDLLLSPTFRQGQALHECWNSWLEALTGPDDQLARYLFEE